MEIGEGTDARKDATPKDDVVRIKVRISLFFDGTRNNRRNARVRYKIEQIDRERAEQADSPKVVRVGQGAQGTYDRRSDPAPDVDEATARRLLREYNKGDVSWAGDVTNVVRLEENLDPSLVSDHDYYLHVYTEGIGTADLHGDSKYNAAVADGETGTVAKVERGIANALAAINGIANRRRGKPIVKGQTIIEVLTIDTCGFSRGAAAARYCIHRVLDDGPPGAEPGRGTCVSLKTQLTRSGWRDVENVRVRAVGLFDTVSSFGVKADKKSVLLDADLAVGDFEDNTATLHLKAVSRAAAVYQIAAAEEYRANFSLTNIDSAGGRGRQVYLPGAHSDIGGGYVDGSLEQQVLVAGEAAAEVAAFMRQRGWYQGDELTLRVLPLPMARVTRGPISRAYTFVPLGLMGTFLRQQGVPVTSNLDTDFAPGALPRLPEISKHAHAIGFPGTGGGGAGSTVSRPEQWEEDLSGDMKRLRHSYLHVSFRQSDAGMSVRLVNLAFWPLTRYRPVRHVAHG